MLMQDEDDFEDLNLSADWPRASKLMTAIRRKLAKLGGGIDCGGGGGGGACGGGGGDDDDGSGLATSLRAPPPSHFCCPISCEVMEVPVKCADGVTYEASCIQEWLERSSMSPMTSEELVSLDLQPDEATATAIAHWRAAVCPS
jgi:hypothetical protein